MDFSLQALRRRALAGLVLPQQRFFKPRPEFFQILSDFKVGYVDAGCGTGETTIECRAAGLQILGVDICARDGQVEGTLIADAILMPYTDVLWPVICRPSHDGWAEDVVDAAFRRGASVLYAGFAKNHRRDLGPHVNRIVQRWRNVGEEREGLYLLRSKAAAH